MQFHAENSIQHAVLNTALFTFRYIIAVRLFVFPLVVSVTGHTHRPRPFGNVVILIMCIYCNLGTGTHLGHIF